MKRPPEPQQQELDPFTTEGTDAPLMRVGAAAREGEGRAGEGKVSRLKEKGMHPARAVSRQPAAPAASSLTHGEPPQAVRPWAAALNWNDALEYRVEVRLAHDRRRPISRDLLSRADEYFTGAYPFCQTSLKDVDPVRSGYVHSEVEGVLSRQVQACRNSHDGPLKSLIDLGLSAKVIVVLLIAGKPSKHLREAGSENAETLFGSALAPSGGIL